MYKAVFAAVGAALGFVLGSYREDQRRRDYDRRMRALHEKEKESRGYEESIEIPTDGDLDIAKTRLKSALSSYFYRLDAEAREGTKRGHFYGVAADFVDEVTKDVGRIAGRSTKEVLNRSQDHQRSNSNPNGRPRQGE